MYAFKAVVVATLSIALGTLVSAELISRDTVYHCGTDEENPTCPTGYTCCGPIISGVGGTCILLSPGEVCAF
ncbi:hypothetical protein GYMLUDRAFT_35922 [Collybiopsis luxurians FD-317 M1]|nr:hypothetical protein GYMLUDRAFT_35922 [Collybiopsis luxurians FD-317 M1]